MADNYLEKQYADYEKDAPNGSVKKNWANYPKRNNLMFIRQHIHFTNYCLTDTKKPKP